MNARNKLLTSNDSFQTIKHLHYMSDKNLYYNPYLDTSSTGNSDQMEFEENSVLANAGK